MLLAYYEIAAFAYTKWSDTRRSIQPWQGLHSLSVFYRSDLITWVYLAAFTIVEYLKGERHLLYRAIN